MTGCGIGNLETVGWSSDWRLEREERPMRWRRSFRSGFRAAAPSCGHKGAWWAEDWPFCLLSLAKGWGLRVECGS